MRTADRYLHSERRFGTPLVAVVLRDPLSMVMRNLDTMVRFQQRQRHARVPNVQFTIFTRVFNIRESLSRVLCHCVTKFSVYFCNRFVLFLFSFHQ